VTRDELAAEVARLEGGERPFVEALTDLAGRLGEGERRLLQEILLERSGGLDYALEQRIEARGWLRRQWDAAGRRPR